MVAEEKFVEELKVCYTLAKHYRSESAEAFYFEDRRKGRSVSCFLHPLSLSLSFVFLLLFLCFCFFFFLILCNVFYTTKKAEKTLAAAALTKFACQLFWAANEAETEDWFTWFATRVKMTEKQFAREVERRGGEVEMTAEVQQAIATLAGKSFHMPPHPPSTKHVPSATKPVPQHPTADGEDDAKMEETPTNDGEDMDQGTSSSFFLFFFSFLSFFMFTNF